MYQLNHSTHHSHKIAAFFLFLAICLLVGGGIWAYKELQPENTVSQSKPQSTQVSVATPKTKTVKGSGFSMKLPLNWKPVKIDSPYTVFSWAGSNKQDNARQIDVYVNNLPTNLAFNRLLPVKANEDGLVVAGDVSENCVNFTDKKNTNRTTGAAPAKWYGINFYCDMANYIRDVVGIGSNDGTNMVKVTSESGKTYKFLIVYTDHNAEADYDVFTDILATFKAV
jgi:hypothetical protein